MSVWLIFASVARRLILAICAAAVAAPHGAIARVAPPPLPEHIQRFDRNSARAHANLLMPIITDEVLDGQRVIFIGLPRGGELGIAYSFRLRPRPVRYQPFCELQLVHLRYEFAAGQPNHGWSVREVDILALKRAGALRPGEHWIHRSFLELAPAPQSEEEHARRCLEADTESGWQSAAVPSELRTADYYLERLHALLSGDPRNVALRCVDRSRNPCAASAETIRETLRWQPNGFRRVSLADGRGWAEFSYVDGDAMCGTGARAIIIEEHAGQIPSVILVRNHVLCVTT